MTREDRTWLVEQDGRPLAMLVQPHPAADAAETWTLVPLARDEARTDLFSAAFWQSGHATFRDPRTGLIAPHTLSGDRAPTPDEPTVTLRRLPGGRLPPLTTGEVLGLAFAALAGLGLLTVPWGIGASFGSIFAEFGNRPDDLPWLTRLAIGTWYPLSAGAVVLGVAVAAQRARSLGARRLSILAAVALGLLAGTSVIVGFYLPIFRLAGLIKAD
jgi:hypothetical protein